jgi:hypothetical protein
MSDGVEKSLESLAQLAWRERLAPSTYRRARELTNSKISRKDKMEALVDELHRQFVLAPDPVKETITVRPPDGASLDADDACLFVAAAAMSVGIPCRFIGVRYGHSWTCWLSYYDAGRWETIDPLRQKRPDREPDEQVQVSLPKETK